MVILSRMGRLTTVCCAVLTLAACGGATTGPPPVSSSRPPSTATSPYTATGTTLRVGQPATVPWQDDLKAGNPVGALRLTVTAVSDGEVGGLAVPDPGAPPSFNDDMFLVRVSADNTGTIAVHPGGLFGLVTVYDAKGDAMTPATTSDPSCTGSLGSADPLPVGGQSTDCKAYLGNVLTPHVAKVVFSGFADPGVTITWTP